jgi:uncharacterized protein (DUF2267 family)
MRIFERFVTLLEHRTDLDRDDALNVGSTVLEILFERLSGGEAADIAEQLRLPAGFVSDMLLVRPRPAVAFDMQEFRRRVMAMARLDAATADRYSVAVVAAVRTMTTKEFSDMVAQLPRDFAVLIKAAERQEPEITSPAEFVRTVAEDTGLEPEQARQAIAAVLETLAERIAQQEVDELLADLDDELADALRRGSARRPGAIRGMSPRKFVGLVAAREGADRELAGQHTRVVLGTLADAVSEEHFADLLARLPDEYADLVPPR